MSTVSFLYSLLIDCLTRRNMATCRNQSVSRRLVSMGLMGTTISLVMEGLNSTPMSDAQASYIEQLTACVSNLCASCEEAVVELRSRQFCPSLVHILSSGELNSSIKRAAAQCLHTATENEAVISESISSLPGGVDVLVTVAQQCSTAQDLDMKLCGLYCLGTLVNICGSLPSGNTTDLTQKMQQILPMLLSALEPSEDILNLCISPTIDDELTESQKKKAGELPTDDNGSLLLDESTSTSTMTYEMNDEGMGDDLEGGGDDDVDDQKEEGGGEEVYVGGDVDKPWMPTFEVLEVAAEVLANIAVILKEQCGGADEEERGDYDEGEWDDDDENERRMEAIAAMKGARQDEDGGVDFSSRRVELGVFDVRSAVGSLISVSTKLHTCIDVMISRCDKEHAKFPSSSNEIMSCTDKLSTALTNFLYLVNDWTETDVHTLMDILLKQFNSFATVFRGVTPSGAAGDSSTATNIWALSSLLEQSKLQSVVRNTLSATVSCLATLHRMPMDESLLSMANPMNPTNKTLRGMRMVTLIRGIASVPFWEVTQHCLDMVSFLSSIELQFSEVKVISNTLLRRLSDPSALRVRTGTRQMGARSLCDASILVMEACISAFIDLHSSDDRDIYSVSVRNITSF